MIYRFQSSNEENKVLSETPFKFRVEIKKTIKELHFEIEIKTLLYYLNILL